MDPASVSADVPYLGRSRVKRQLAEEKRRRVPANRPGVVLAVDAVLQHPGIGVTAVKIKFVAQLATLQFAEQFAPIRLEESPSTLPGRPTPAVCASQKEGLRKRAVHRVGIGVYADDPFVMFIAVERSVHIFKEMLRRQQIVFENNRLSKLLHQPADALDDGSCNPLVVRLFDNFDREKTLDLVREGSHPGNLLHGGN